MKIIDKFIYDFFIFHDKRNKKGYQVIGLKLTFIFFGIIILLIATSFLLLSYENLWLLLLAIVLVVALIRINKKIDILLLRNIQKQRAEHKEYIEKYLKDKLGFNNSVQYKETSLLLKSIGDRDTVTYNLTPYLAMILTAFVTTIGIVAKGDYVTHLIGLLIIITVILISINPAVNGFANLFLNIRPNTILQISGIIHELFIERSVKENIKK